MQNQGHTEDVAGHKMGLLIQGFKVPSINTDIRNHQGAAGFGNLSGNPLPFADPETFYFGGLISKRNLKDQVAVGRVGQEQGAGLYFQHLFDLLHNTGQNLFQVKTGREGSGYIVEKSHLVGLTLGRIFEMAHFSRPALARLKETSITDGNRSLGSNRRQEP